MEKAWKENFFSWLSASFLVSKCCQCIFTSVFTHLELTCCPKMRQCYCWDVSGEESYCHRQCLKPAERVMGSLLQHFGCVLSASRVRLDSSVLPPQKKTRSAFTAILFSFSGPLLLHLKLKSPKISKEWQQADCEISENVNLAENCGL